VVVPLHFCLLVRVLVLMLFSFVVCLIGFGLVGLSLLFSSEASS